MYITAELKDGSLVFGKCNRKSYNGIYYVTLPEESEATKFKSSDIKLMISVNMTKKIKLLLSDESEVVGRYEGCSSKNSIDIELISGKSSLVHCNEYDKKCVFKKDIVKVIVISGKNDEIEKERPIDFLDNMMQKDVNYDVH